MLREARCHIPVTLRKSGGACVRGARELECKNTSGRARENNTLAPCKGIVHRCTQHHYVKASRTSREGAQELKQEHRFQWQLENSPTSPRKSENKSPVSPRPLSHTSDSPGVTLRTLHFLLLPCQTGQAPKRLSLWTTIRRSRRSERVSAPRCAASRLHEKRVGSATRASQRRQAWQAARERCSLLATSLKRASGPLMCRFCQHKVGRCRVRRVHATTARDSHAEESREGSRARLLRVTPMIANSATLSDILLSSLSLRDIWCRVQGKGPAGEPDRRAEEDPP